MDRPDYFYKYRSFDGAGKEFTRQIIEDRKLYYSHPSSFNDPFDCAPVFSFEADPLTTRQYLRALFEKFQPELSESEREMTVIAAMQSDAMMNRDIIKEITQSSMERLSNSIGILSISEVCDDLLMWSHYASSHQGICLQFYSSMPPFRQAQKVLYRDKRPTANLFTDSPETIHEKSVLTKSRNWEYEKEWRIIDHGYPGEGLHRYPRTALCGVIFGARMSIENKNLVRQWARRRINLRVREALIDPANFSLKILEI